MSINISIYLPSKIDAFNFNELHLKHLKKKYPKVHFKNFKSKNNFKNSLQDCNIALTWIFKKEWYNNTSNLSHIYTPAAGHDWIDADPNDKIKIYFSKFHGQLMGESLLGMILHMNRNFSKLIEHKNMKKWERNIQSKLPQLSNQTILIAGFGNIAKGFCKLIKPFNCKIFALQTTYSNQIDNNTGAIFITQNELNKYLPKADHLVSILPANESTNNFFNESHFKVMKKTAFFYNIGRGNCVEDNVIDKMVRDNVIAGAALDVFNEEPLKNSSSLWSNSKIFISPHSSAIFKNYLDLFLEEIEPKLTKLIK